MPHSNVRHGLLKPINGGSTPVSPGRRTFFCALQQADDKGPIAALLQKDQFLAYLEYASDLIFFLRLALEPFLAACKAGMLKYFSIVGLPLFEHRYLYVQCLPCIFCQRLFFGRREPLSLCLYDETIIDLLICAILC